MKNNQLFAILKSLSKKEFSDLGRFVESPFHNSRKEVVKYFNCVKPHFPDFDETKVNNEVVFKEMYPAKGFDDSVIRKLASFLKSIAERFIAYKGLMGDTFYPDYALAVELSNRGLNNIAAKKIELLEKEYASASIDTEFHFWKKYMIERHKNVIYSFSQNDHLASESMGKRADMLAYHTSIMSFRTMVSLTMNQMNFNYDHSNGDFRQFFSVLDSDRFINILNEKKSPGHKTASLYYNQAMALTHIENDNFFFEYEKLINSEIERFTHTEKVNLISVYEAICTLKIESGKSEFSGVLFNSYKRLLDKNLYSYYPGGDFILRIFRNIVHTAILVNELEWVDNFLGNYLEKLPLSTVNNMKNLAYALLEFEKKNYEISLQLISQIDYELFHFKIDVKNLQLKLFYELGYTSEIYSLIDSYKHFLSESKFISIRYKSLAGGFVDYVSRISKVSESKNMKDKINIESDLKRDNVLFKNWLQQKLIEI